MEIYEDVKFIKKFNKLARFGLTGNLQKKKNYLKNRWSNKSLDECYNEYFYEKLIQCLYYIINNPNYNFPYKDICKELHRSEDNDNLLIAFEIVYKNTRNLRKRYGYK